MVYIGWRLRGDHVKGPLKGRFLSATIVRMQVTYPLRTTVYQNHIYKVSLLSIHDCKSQMDREQIVSREYPLLHTLDIFLIWRNVLGCIPDRRRDVHTRLWRCPSSFGTNRAFCNPNEVLPSCHPPAILTKYYWFLYFFNNFRSIFSLCSSFPSLNSFHFSS